MTCQTLKLANRNYKLILFFPCKAWVLSVHFLIVTFPTLVKAAALRSSLQCCVLGPSVNPGEENSQDLYSAILSKTGRHVTAQTSDPAV